MDATSQLKAIRDEILANTTLPLYAYRTEHKYFPVLGEGSHSAKLMFVGEAPGEKEALSGRPFCGAAGKLLDTMLESIQLERASVYITNLVKDRPPENRDPSETEIAAYGPFLLRQINAIQPKVICTLGRYSLQFILAHFGLAEFGQTIRVLHGRPLTTIADYGPITIIPLYHPAAALYNGGLRGTLLEDFQIIQTYL